MPSPVFLDSSGKRNAWVSRLGIVFSLLLIVVSVLFARTLIALPFLPPLATADSSHRFRAAEFPFFPSRQEQIERVLLRRARLALWKEIASGQETRLQLNFRKRIAKTTELNIRTRRRQNRVLEMARMQAQPALLANPLSRRFMRLIRRRV